MPNVKHLHISLSLEQDVSFIMEKMTKLQSLNGITVESNSDGSGSGSKSPVDSPMDIVPEPQPGIDSDGILA